MAQQMKKVSEIEAVKAAIIRHQWGMSGDKKVTRYVGKFFDRQRAGKTRHRYFNELGATKLAVLWVIENVEVDTASGTMPKMKM